MSLPSAPRRVFPTTTTTALRSIHEEGGEDDDDDDGDYDYRDGDRDVEVDPMSSSSANLARRIIEELRRDDEEYGEYDEAMTTMRSGVRVGVGAVGRSRSFESGGSPGSYGRG